MSKGAFAQRTAPDDTERRRPVRLFGRCRPVPCDVWTPLKWTLP